MGYAILVALAAAILCTPSLADARNSRSHSSHAVANAKSSAHRYGHAKALGVARDAHGKIAHSTKAKDAFKQSHPCPSTGKTHRACPGYVIDHVTPLKRGGADAVSNMQWQTVAGAKAKDRSE